MVWVGGDVRAGGAGVDVRVDVRVGVGGDVIVVIDVDAGMGKYGCRYRGKCGCTGACAGAHAGGSIISLCTL